MDNTWKKCPICGGEIYASATRCRHCREDISERALRALEEKKKREEEIMQAEAAKIQREAEELARKAAEERKAAEARKAAEEAARLEEEARLEAAASEAVASATADSGYGQTASMSAGTATATMTPSSVIPNPVMPQTPTPIAPESGYGTPDFSNNVAGSQVAPAPAPFKGGSSDFYFPEGEKQGFFNRYFIGTFFRNFANFSGSTSRRTYWLSYLASMITMLTVFAVVFGVGGLLSMGYSHISMDEVGITAYIAYFALALVLFIPNLALLVRRMHSLGKSGAMIFVPLIPIVGSIWFFVLLCSKETEATDDDYVVPGSKFGKSSWIVILLLVAGTAAGIYGINNQRRYSLYDYDDSTPIEEDLYEVDLPAAAVEEYAPAAEAPASAYEYSEPYAVEAEEEDEYVW